MAEMIRLTVAQALVRFLSVQFSERDGTEHRLIPGCFGIFGHGNVAGIGEALLEAQRGALHGALHGALAGDEPCLRYWPGRNEQALAHAAAAFARQRGRMSALAVTTSVGPGATNLVTGAALATINRLPVLLLPGDVFATRPAPPVLQELEDVRWRDVSVNDTLRPVSAFFDRVQRPEQLPGALLGAMGVLTDPAQTGAVTLALPQDVQAEAHDWPARLFTKRIWHVARPTPDPAALARAAELIRSARRPLIVSGGGTIYSDATAALATLAEAAGIPVAETQAGKGSLPYDHPLAVGAIGVTGSTAANTLAAEADVVIGVGTRYTDFTTGSQAIFSPDAAFVNLNVAGADARKQAGLALVADARGGLEALVDSLAGWSASPAYRALAARLSQEWEEQVDRAYRQGHQPLPAQPEIIGAVNEAAGPRDVVVCAAGSMPGELHRLWRARAPGSYHVEYGYSCMGYEIAGGLGAKLACPDREVFVLVGDGSYLMMGQELVTAVQEHIKIIVVLVDNHGYASIGSLSESLGGQRFGTAARYRDPASGRLDGPVLPVDLAANAGSLGATVLRAGNIDGLRAALDRARAHRGGPVVIHIETDPMAPPPPGGAWWDVPVSEVSALEPVRAARRRYEAGRAGQRAPL